MRQLFIVFVLLIGGIAVAQNISATELLEKTIEFHDPNKRWNTFKGSFKITMQTPKSSERLSIIALNNPKEQFNLKVEKDSAVYQYDFDGEKCTTTLNGSPEVTDAARKKYRLTCERGKMMRNYYTYLYGLPMKLKDPGTIIDDKVQHKKFKGKDYLVLKVNYTEGVGDDVWYFYFDPKTYAMEVYQFYHDETKNDGEYILLEDLEDINGIKMPKKRAWYYNKDNTYLATDTLKGSAQK
ncbi:DUF6503 family protein [Flagellimonas sp. HMM57]|uniref:DUF6503 family protein n=1 Tax=unclassified Flagellimonas TaxID=2644544 RepID=UPI0013D1E34D|nr:MULTISPECIES: DUF6503 family protein [unclassified Flagellimonas]UII77425.1 DUF6503 family protein [Flagellimonas sp. HMM57]